MLRDVFYYGKKPNVHPREKFASSLQDARNQSTTEHFWIINEFCDYKNFDWDFDFDFLPDEDVWAEDHNNVWPSVYQKDSGTWLCSKNDSDIIIYRGDVEPLKRKNEKNSHWEILQPIDEAKFDFGWHPDPTSPPYVYVWGNKWVPAELKPTLKYHVEGATQEKYMSDVVEVVPEKERWVILEDIEEGSFDFTWRPDPREPNLIWVFGNKQHSGRVMPTIEYRAPDATEQKFIETHGMQPKLAAKPELFRHLEDSYGIDYSWRPDPTSPPYVYVWGNQWNKPEDKISIQYVVEGATEYKYMEERAIRKPCMDNWEIPNNIDVSDFDFSWEPNPHEPAYIYEFGTQWQKTGGPRYVVDGATEIKYIDIQKAKALPSRENWTVPVNCDVTGFDFSWHPDSTSPAYIYNFATQWAMTGGPTYTVPGATEVTYVEFPMAIALPDRTNWVVPNDVDADSFDFSWHPYVEDQPYIYQFGTQHQKTGGPKYITPGATSASPVKYIDTRILKAKRLANKKRFAILDNLKIKDFDFSWHPDETEEPYIYVFGNNQYPAEIMPTIEYAVSGATQIKYVNDVVATLDVDMTNWEVPDNVDVTGFDFSWKPNPKDPAYIYEFGTQWQKTGGPRYVVDGATETKYVTTHQVKALPTTENWTIPANCDVTGFDFSWHPDNTSPAYVYHFATQWAMTGGPIYTVPGATEVTYVEFPMAIALPDKTNWVIPNDVDVESFDFSWHPYVEDQPYIYQFGTQWQKTGGPKYVTPGATSGSPVKYIDTRILKATRLANQKRFAILDNLKIKDFDFSWHPDETEEPYIYVFGNNQYPAEIMPTIEYRVPGAKQVKYVQDIVATLDVDMTYWEVPDNIDVTGFDFSWKPNPNDPSYIYQFGTQWQKTGGPRYVVPDATEVKYVTTKQVKALPNRRKFSILDNLKVIDFDFSWHPDDTEEPYIYVFGNNQYPAEIMPTIEYAVPGATQIKYVNDVVATLGADKINWEIPENIDIDGFDFSWKPNPKDPAYIYEFGTQWQKTGGPRYVVPDATEVKYVDTMKVKHLKEKRKFVTIGKLKVKEFDYSWHPDSTEEPYIYVFGNNQYPAEIMPTIEYRMADATQIKYVNDVVATLDVDMTNWEVPDNVDVTGFDFSWKPNPKDPAYIYEFGTQWQKTGGPRYLVDGATEIKYVDTQKVKRYVVNRDACWVIPEGLDISEFDFSWHPDATEKPYIYQFGTQWAMTGGPKYVAEGATEIKYVDNPIAKAPQRKDNWIIPKNIDESSFDFSWHPYMDDQPYVYQFGTQWQKTGGPQYVAPGADETSFVKYIDTRILKAKILPDRKNWYVPDNVDPERIDYSWHPDATEQPYVYHFGTQWNERGGPEYRVPGATQYKYISDIVGYTKPDKTNWHSLMPIDESKFDYSWTPHPDSPPYIYVFGNQWFSAEKEPTIEYRVPGATQKKYIDVITAYALPDMTKWEVKEGVDVSKFDFSWRPDPGSPPYIYQFGTLSDVNDGPRYITPNNTGEVVYLERKELAIEDVLSIPRYFIKTTLEALAEEHKDELFWALNPDLDYSNFDFDWKPSIEQASYVHAFGSRNNLNTQTYFVNGPMWHKGHREMNYVEDKLVEVKTNIDMFFVDRGNHDAASRLEKLKAKYPNIQKTRYLNTWVDTINRCINRADSNLCWILDSQLDYSNFDFDYYPNPWQMKMVHVFGTQWSHWGTTFMVNRETFAEDTKYIKIIEHLSNLNFVKENRAVATNCLYDIVLVDHGNKETETVLELLKKKVPYKDISVVKFVDSYLKTFQNFIHRVPDRKENYLWICSSVCDYTEFQFNYVPDPFAKDQLHVFPSDRQKFGDTFLVDVTKTKTLIDDLTLLDEYKKVNYNQHQRVKRLPAPVIVTGDTHVDIVNKEFDFPYAVLVTEDNQNIKVNNDEPMALWAPNKRNIIISSSGGTHITVPRDVKDYIKKELYDYPYIKPVSRLQSSNPMDIVFLSNGEKCADENYKHLLDTVKGLPNRVVRVDGVNGRVQAYHAAVNASNTPWAFTVFAKLKVSNKFDWGWQPDRLQVPKHYIFHAKNPVNDLVYGHQAMIAYNKKLVLANDGSKGLDFTLDDEHEVIEMLSGVAMFNTDEFSTWRTAFREALKLHADTSEISKQRLRDWLTKAKGDFAEYSINGAKDAIEYFESVSGDMAKLKLSYEWNWLQDYFNQKYKK